MKMKSIDSLASRAKQHFVDSIAVKQDGAVLLPTEVAKAIALMPS